MWNDRTGCPDSSANANGWPERRVGIPRPSGPLRVKMKVCLVGDHTTRKTDLIRPYVQDNFDDKYVQTLGTKVSKKELQVPNPLDGSIFLDMTIWDIVGRREFRTLTRDAYYFGARGVLGVCDIRRPETVTQLNDWIMDVQSVCGRIPRVILAIRRGSHKRHPDGEEATRLLASFYHAPCFFVSLRRHANVEPAILVLALLILWDRFGRF